ncbi:TetR family transcriptional regulator [Pontiella agarivorans]|uniref:TetR family transcriptional regulator n=1 Tax=Pontiella agarivorans TaxID=3038953 RepID=A0ABU5MYB9_9BACT|nr:TetR family transcriptional regulator [Pontiella agarivorans]MDZ8118976.1 TetR family transcriptional regulator [Pontiella agarivorans]
MRRTKEDADKTRAAILKAALKVFYKKGVSRSTLTDIGQAAGVTRGAVYHHFKDKVDLFLQLSAEITNSRHFNPEIWSDDSVQTLDDLREVILERLRLFFDDRDMHKFMMTMFSRMEYIDDFKEFWINAKKDQQHSIQSLEKALIRLKDNGEVRAEISPAHAARHIYIFIDGIYDCWSIDEKEFLIREELEEAVDEFLMLFKPV